MKILQISDVHLDINATRLGKYKIVDGKNEVYEKRLLLFRRAIYSAIENDVNLVAICGDVFERNRPYPVEYADLIWSLDCLPSRIQVVIISGNHDELTSKGCAISTLAGRRETLFAHFEPFKTTLGLEFPVVLAPWGTDIKDLPDNSILLFHAGVKSGNAQWVELDGEVGNISLDDLTTSNAQAVLLGHHHNQIELSKNIWYSGSLDVVGDFSEEGDKKGLLLWEIDAKGVSVNPISTNEYVDKFKTFGVDEFLEYKEKGWEGYVRVKGDVTDKQRLEIVKRISKFKCMDYKLDLKSSVRSNKVYNLEGKNETDILTNYLKNKGVKNIEEIVKLDKEINYGKSN